VDLDLIGYLLNALDPTDRHEVETALARDPQARRRLEELRQGLAPLEADRDAIDPPPDLVVRTIARVAEHCCLGLPRAPAPSRRGASLTRPFFRRADVLVAASVLVILTGLGLGWVIKVRSRNDVLVCQDNMTRIYQGLKGYSDLNRGRFPDIARASGQPARNVAGMVVPILASSGQLPDNASCACPALDGPCPSPMTVAEVLALSDEEFAHRASRLAFGYAYSLGYQEDGEYRGPRFDEDQPNGQLPILSDSPPFDPSAGNSPNHGGRGQNVLFMDGHVRFCTSRAVGVNGDDIFVNRDNRVGAGLDRLDTVLGRNTARPWPDEE
jgi:prepilin-type processing-associated H-X9-DG protein